MACAVFSYYEIEWDRMRQMNRRVCKWVDPFTVSILLILPLSLFITMFHRLNISRSNQYTMSITQRKTKCVALLRKLISIYSKLVINLCACECTSRAQIYFLYNWLSFFVVAVIIIIIIRFYPQNVLKICVMQKKTEPNGMRRRRGESRNAFVYMEIRIKNDKWPNPKEEKKLKYQQTFTI